MCGFAGLLRWNGLAPEDTARVKAAAARVAHRGPDSSGFYNDTHIALGFQRLKVIDLSPAGEQPMCNEDGSLWVVFNGEIYNFRELREELRASGHTFKSQSDTEVLLHGYEQWGEEMLGRLRGMFAFALWNATERKLVLARDPLGVKPLYFAEREGFLAFASEPKALFALGVEPEIDPVAIHEALTYRYVPPPRSGFKDVEKLPPGHVATAQGGEVGYRRWWYGNEHESWLREIFISADARDLASLGRGVREILRATVARRLVSDVPLGAWLSGGIDSGLVTSELNGSARTFCAGFKQEEYDERALARATAARLSICQSVHTDFEIPADVFKLLPQIVWHCDEPYFDSSCLPTFVLAEKTKPHATVVLSGDGGDETFAGYERYVGMKMYRTYRKVPGLLRKLALAMTGCCGRQSRQGWDRILRWLESCRLMEESRHHPYLAAMQLFSEEQKAALYGEAMAEATDGCDGREYLENALLRAAKTDGETGGRGDGAKQTELKIQNSKLKIEDEAEVQSSGRTGGQFAIGNPQSAIKDSTGVLQRADLETYLPGDVLHKVDRMSMAHGLEVRSPFLDVDLVSFALSLPDEARLPGRVTKPLLRRAAKGVLPDQVIKARKRGFGVPLDDWFRGPLKKTALEIFEGSELVRQKLFKPRYWEPLWEGHQSGKAQHGERLYALLSLELWYRMFIVGPVPERRPEALH
ncbi:MAG TPA: asparagine synthase (glutamine-hydrolyzing) [Planctomycetota bacterium]|jgi:asparagine synthase (glutamine-hydrolysing)